MRTFERFYVFMSTHMSLQATLLRKTLPTPGKRALKWLFLCMRPDVACQSPLGIEVLTTSLKRTLKHLRPSTLRLRPNFLHGHICDILNKNLRRERCHRRIRQWLNTWKIVRNDDLAVLVVKCAGNTERRRQSNNSSCLYGNRCVFLCTNIICWKIISLIPIFSSSPNSLTLLSSLFKSK